MALHGESAASKRNGSPAAHDQSRLEATCLTRHGHLTGRARFQARTPVSSTGRHIEETRRYLHDLVAYLARTSTAIELYEAMLSLHPNRVNPGSLWAAAKAFKPS